MTKQKTLPDLWLEALREPPHSSGASQLPLDGAGFQVAPGRDVPELSIALVTTSRELFDLEREWDTLLGESASPNVFLTWDWTSTSWEHFHAGMSPWLLTAREVRDGRLVGIAPWAQRRLPFAGRGPYRELLFLSGGDLSADHLDIIADARHADAVASSFLERARRERWDVMRFDGLSTRSSIARSLAGQGASSWSHVSTLVCPFAPLPSRWEDFEGNLSQKLRYNLRSRTRRLERDAGGRVAFRTVVREEEIGAALAALARLRWRSPGARGGRGGFAGNKAKLAFHEQVARRFLRRDWLRLHLLEVAGEAIAVSYCYRYRDVVYFFHTGYDRRWSRYGPGALITAHSIREAIREGAREFDFLRGDHAYKFQWTNRARHDYKLRLAPTLLGKLAVTTYRLVRRVRAGIRSRRREEDEPPAREDAGCLAREQHRAG